MTQITVALWFIIAMGIIIFLAGSIAGFYYGIYTAHQDPSFGYPSDSSADSED